MDEILTGFAHCPICPAFLRRMRWHWSACLMLAMRLCALGITFSIAMVISKWGSVNGKGVLRDAFFLSMPFVTSLVMILLCAAQIHLPQPVYTVAGMIGQANSFLAMLLIGILFVA